MGRAFGHRLGAAAIQLFFASLLVFALIRVLPGDLALSILADTPHTIETREALREELGLNDPQVVQYARWLWETLTGLRGVARSTGEPIRALVARQLGVTLLLALYAVTISLAFAIPLGIAAAHPKRRVLGAAVEGVTALGLAVPGFWVALLLILGLLRLFAWSPPIIYFGPLEFFSDHFALMIWPAILLAWQHAAHLLPVVRAETSRALANPFTVAARARGLSERRVLYRHAGRLALWPAISVSGVQFGGAIAGSLVLETIFGIPGIGRGLVNAALARDLPLVQTLVFVIVAIVLGVMLAADLLGLMLDPRTRYTT